MESVDSMGSVDSMEKEYACWLDCIYWLSSEVKYRLMSKAGSAKNIYYMSDKEIVQVTGESNLKRIKEQRLRLAPTGLVARLAQKGIKYTYYMEESFPRKLLDIPDPPFGLFYKGELPNGGLPTVAIIGARKCSDYGKYMAEKFAAGLAQNGVDIVSGMACGIDGISQRVALENGVRSYGVLGSGVDVIYPKINEQLYYNLIEKGAVISEYSPGMEAKPSLFPPRNRIISGLADVVLVVEAREKSGTLITVDMALEQGKDVYAVPGRCSDALSQGCNRLLRQGAFVATSYQDIIDDMNWQMVKAKANTKTKKLDVSPNAEAVYEVLDVMVQTQDMIINLLRAKGVEIAVPALCQALLELEIKGYAIRENGQYRKSSK